MPVSNPPQTPPRGPAEIRARPTMRDVAALAGVSLKTVSRVINGEPTVAPELAAKVEQAAEMLHYRPDLTARSLRSNSGRTRTIGLLIENVANPFSSSLHRAVEDVAHDRDVVVFAGSLDEDPARERKLALAFISRRVDGLIVVPAGDDQSYLSQEQHAGLHVVFVDRPPSILRADTVLADNLEGAREAVRHLIAAGHRRIAFLGDLHQIATVSQRLEGYRRALADAGLRYEPELVRLDLHDVAAAAAAAQSLLAERRPTALFASQNLITIGACRALRARGLQTEVALVGFDDFLLADMLEPPVTVIAQDPAAMGEAASIILFERMDGDQSPFRTHIVPTRLIIRGSGEIAPRTQP